jgi:hypothetical protein
VTSNDETNNELASLRFEYPDIWPEIVRALGRIEKQLSTDPMRFKDDDWDGTFVGREFFQDETAVNRERPLWVQFEVFPLDMLVHILHFSLNRPSSQTGPGYRPHNN